MKGTTMDQNIAPNPERTVRRMTRLTVLVSALIFGISSLVLIPVYIQLSSNIATKDSLFTWILYYLTDEGLLDLCVFAVCYPAAIYAVWQVGLKKAMRVPVAFSLITLGRFVLNYIMNAITDKALPGFQKFWEEEFFMIAALYVLEILQYALPILFAVLLKRRYEQKQAEREAWGEDTRQPEALFLFARLFSFKNPVQLSAFLMGAVIFVFSFAAHQIYQYALFITSGSTDGLLYMALDFFSDLFVAVILYFIALLLIQRFHRKGCEAARAESV